jgi:hypothetical protein
VNWSAPEVADVPPVVVTLTSTTLVPAGEVAVIWVAELTVNPAAAVAPKATAVVPEKLVPVMITTVPPLPGPVVGEIEVTAGAGM